MGQRSDMKREIDIGRAYGERLRQRDKRKDGGRVSGRMNERETILT